VKRLVRYIASLQRQQYLAAARWSGHVSPFSPSFAKYIFRITLERFSSVSPCFSWYIVERALPFRSACSPHCPFAFCVAESSSVAIEFLYVRAIYNIGQNAILRHIRRLDFEATEIKRIAKKPDDRRIILRV